VHGFSPSLIAIYTVAKKSTLRPITFFITSLLCRVLTAFFKLFHCSVLGSKIAINWSLKVSPTPTTPQMRSYTILLYIGRLFNNWHWYFTRECRDTFKVWWDILTVTLTENLLLFVHVKELWSIRQIFDETTTKKLAVLWPTVHAWYQPAIAKDRHAFRMRILYPPSEPCVHWQIYCFYFCVSVCLCTEQLFGHEYLENGWI